MSLEICSFLGHKQTMLVFPRNCGTALSGTNEVFRSKNVACGFAS